MPFSSAEALTWLYLMILPDGCDARVVEQGCVLNHKYSSVIVSEGSLAILGV